MSKISFVDIVANMSDNATQQEIMQIESELVLEAKGIYILTDEQIVDMESKLAVLKTARDQKNLDYINNQRGGGNVVLF